MLLVMSIYSLYHVSCCIYLCMLAIKSNPMIQLVEKVDAIKAGSQCMEVDRLLEGYLTSCLGSHRSGQSKASGISILCHSEVEISTSKVILHLHAFYSSQSLMHLSGLNQWTHHQPPNGMNGSSI